MKALYILFFTCGFLLKSGEDGSRVKPLRQLASDFYLKHCEESVSYNNARSVQNYNKAFQRLKKGFCETLPDHLSYPLSLRFLYTTRALKTTEIKVLCDGLLVRAQQSNNKAMEQCFEYMRDKVDIFRPLTKSREFLFEAVKLNKRYVVTSLIDCGVSPDACRGLDSLLLYAVKQRRYEIVEDLLKIEVDPNDGHSFHPLYHAALYHDEQMVLLLQQYKACKNRPYKQWSTMSCEEKINELYHDSLGADQEHYLKVLDLLQGVD